MVSKISFWRMRDGRRAGIYLEARDAALHVQTCVSDLNLERLALRQFFELHASGLQKRQVWRPLTALDPLQPSSLKERTQCVVSC